MSEEVLERDEVMEEEEEGDEEEAPRKKAKAKVSKKGKAGKAKAGKKGKASGNGNGAVGTRYELFGHPVTAVIRWMGKNKMTWKQAQKALTAHGVEPAPATIKIQTLAGRKGDRGDPAPLTKEQGQKLLKYRKEEKEDD